MSTKAAFDWSSLAHFTGSMERYRDTFSRNVLSTEGIHHLCTEASCFWLIDLVGSHQLKKRVKAEYHQLWRIERHGKEGALVTCRRDTNDKPLCRQKIEYTDFPFPEDGSFEFYAIREGQYLIVLLKSEY
jgi:hypothetical protein